MTHLGGVTATHSVSSCGQAELDAGEGALLQRVMTSLARAVRLARSKGEEASAGVDPALLEQPEEEALHQAVQGVRTQVHTERIGSEAMLQHETDVPLQRSCMQTLQPTAVLGTLTARLLCQQVSASTTVPDFLAAAQQLLGPVDAFFDKVFVMVEDEGVRRNRLALLRRAHVSLW